MSATRYAIDALGLKMTASDQPLSLDNAVGIALRHNKQRAHLLVSTLLGKHTPQRPDIIDSAGRILGQYAIDALTGATHDDRYLRRLNDALTTGGAAPAIPAAPAQDVAVVGFAEAASGLGATVADHLNAYYLCSTRTPQREEYGRFIEAHSHAKDHFLTPEDPTALGDERLPVVLVDDELTTGRTAINTIRALHQRAAHPSYIIATLADLRTPEARTTLDAFTEELGVPVKVVALFSASITAPDDVIDRAAGVLATASQVKVEHPALATIHTTIPFTYPDAAQARDGIPAGPALHQAAARLAHSLGTSGGRTLILGVEEDMTLALRTAMELHQLGHDVDFSSTTRSPAALIDHPEYPIRSGIRVDGAWPEPRFIYNVDRRYDRVVVVSADPLYTTTLPVIADALDGHVEEVTVVSVKHLAAPLTGPAFGSYAADDVKWLLKDLSGAALEVSLEDREEAVQNGAHYAESLPQEYQPSEEYMTLFWDALAAGAGHVAQDIAVVAHRIMAARRSRPVLVSLARAGTPVGVLLRRYMRGYLGHNAPHYAVSIVRGRGIDANALAYIAAHHDPQDVIFVDGWTGKGAITTELQDALIEHEERTGVRFGPEIAVLADTGDCTTIYGTRDDYLIPSAALNSTVSGLVSRTVLNDSLIGEDDYHGAKFYHELTASDVSGRFIDEVQKHFAVVIPSTIPPVDAPGWAAWAEVERLSDDYGIGSVNLVKPGVGETTRVLLRRVPWRILTRPGAGDAIAHILALADARGVPVEEVPGLRFNAVGLIHPQFTKGATGADGLTVAA